MARKLAHDQWNVILEAGGVPDEDTETPRATTVKRTDCILDDDDHAHE
ncbi:hypothetical protein RH858_03570 [Halalkaliarchaeum sp. AArc-GB]|nr:hypothetical protein [Halalkaliarchaeum sp. AArc-GB]MDR5672232.1 hypothetical protein [Halalkaliarchaeum sp. AArc-GB]